MDLRVWIDGISMSQDLQILINEEQVPTAILHPTEGMSDTCLV